MYRTSAGLINEDPRMYIVRVLSEFKPGFSLFIDKFNSRFSLIDKNKRQWLSQDSASFSMQVTFTMSKKGSNC